MVYVKVSEDESFEQAMKRFARELKDSGLNEELQKRKFNIKRTTKRREAKKERALKIKIANKYQ
jgi:ribosomal protein S21